MVPQVFRVSHWPVLDAVAPELTAKAIKIMKRNPETGKAGALRAAMMAVRNNKSHDSESLPWSHPRVWAPFSIVGGVTD